MKISFLPKTALGIWSLILSVAGLAFFAAGSLIGDMNPVTEKFKGIDMIVNNPLTSSAVILFFASIIASLVTGIISIAKKKERSILVFLTVASCVMSIPMIIGVICDVFFVR
jgi:hypothetical protein